jgi:mitochondrial import receptor subunit TOM40
MALGKVQVSVSPPQSAGGGAGGDGTDGADGGGGGGGGSDQLLAELDFGGLTWTGNLKYGAMGGGVVVGGNYYQSVTRRCAVGGEGMYVAANRALLSNYLVKFTVPAETGDEDLAGALAGGASAPPAASNPPPPPAAAAPGSGGGSSTFCLAYNAGHGAATVGYRRVVTPNRVQLGAELQFSPHTLESKLLLGAEFRLSRSRLAFCVDPWELRVQSLVEARLGVSPGSPSLNLSADVNHLEDEMRFGYGLTVDS